MICLCSKANMKYYIIGQLFCCHNTRLQSIIHRRQYTIKKQFSFLESNPVESNQNSYAEISSLLSDSLVLKLFHKKSKVPCTTFKGGPSVITIVISITNIRPIVNLHKCVRGFWDQRLVKN